MEDSKCIDSSVSSAETCRKREKNFLALVNILFSIKRTVFLVNAELVCRDFIYESLLFIALSEL